MHEVSRAVFENKHVHEDSGVLYKPPSAKRNEDSHSQHQENFSPFHTYIASPYSTLVEYIFTCFIIKIVLTHESRILNFFVWAKIGSGN